MPIYDVTVQRIEYREHVFRVEADDPDAAYKAGLEAATDYNFGDSPIDLGEEQVVHVCEAP